MNLQSFREGMPWPFGKHWCLGETLLYSFATVDLLVHGTLILALGHPRWFAVPVGAAIAFGGWFCARAVRKNWRRL